MADWRFKVLYDGDCPFCRIEARWLGHLNRRGYLALEDISAPDFDPARYGSTLSELMGTLHGVYPDGRMTRGVETFREAYRAVELGWVLAPTGLRVLRPAFDAPVHPLRPPPRPVGARLRSLVRWRPLFPRRRWRASEWIEDGEIPR